jgi:uncharacterized protein (DUF1697 family)
MEERQVALIRGINVGKAKRVAMAELRTMMARLGYQDCKTLLNSGNLVYSTDCESPEESATRIEQAMKKELGVAAPVTALSAADFDTVVQECSLGDVADNPSRLLVSFFLDPSKRPGLEPLQAEDWGSEAFALGALAAYVWCPEGVLSSRVLPALEKALGQAVTSRNWRTVAKIQAAL